MLLKNLIPSLWGIALFASCTVNSDVTIDYGDISEKSTVLELAGGDLQACFDKYPTVSNNRTFRLSVENDWKNGEFGYRIDGDGNVLFRGGDELGVTHAIYTYLESLGVT